MPKKPMTDKKAIKIAVQAIVKTMHKFAFDANTAVMIAEENQTPHQKNSVKKYKEYNEAISVLEAMGSQGRFRI